MSTICKLCKKDYKYPSKLKIHRTSIYGCVYKDSDYINNNSNINNIIQYKKVNIINNNVNTVQETHNTFNCTKCTKIYKFKYSLTRHMKKDNCSGIIITINNTNQNTTNIKKIDNDSPINNQLINIIVEKTKKIEELIEEKKLLTQNNIEIKKFNDESTINSTSNSTIILNNIIIHSRIEDNYINAIQLCNAGNKIFNDWYSLETTNDLITELEKEIKSDIINIVSEDSEIWIHPDLSVHIANWISPTFTLQIIKWIRKLFTNSTNDKLEININSLKIKDQRIKLLEDTYLKKHTRIKYPDKNVIYILTTEYNKSQRNYIIGKAIDLTNRLSTYNKTSEHEVIYYKSCKDEETMNIVECMVINKLKNYKELANRDRFILPIEKDISFFTNIIDESIKFFI